MLIGSPERLFDRRARAGRVVVSVASSAPALAATFLAGRGVRLPAAALPVRERLAGVVSGVASTAEDFLADRERAGAAVVAAGFFALRVAWRLTEPRTGTRSTNTQPTPGTGLPPQSRSPSKSQVCSPWNSWNESFDRTVASVRRAIPRTKASPRPTAPAGGVSNSPARIACSNSSRSAWSMRFGNVASTTTTTLSKS